MEVDVMKATNNNKGQNPQSNESLAKQDEKNCQENGIVIPDNEYFTFEDEGGVYVDSKIHRLCALDGYGVAYEVSDELHLSKVTKNLDTNHVTITLVQITKWSKSEIIINLDELKSSKLFEALSKKGVMIYEHCIGELVSYLQFQYNSYVDKYGYRYEHYRIGWGKKGRASGFFSSKSIQAPYCSSMWKNDLKYLGPNGDKAIYDSMVQNEIIPNKSMQVPFVLGFTAPVVPLIRKFTDVPVVLVNIAGKSSMGKSTSMKLIASIWGKGVISNKRLSICKTFCATENGFEVALQDNNGLPALFDDYQVATSQSYFSDLIFRITAGESKITCNKKRKLTDTFDWSTFVAFTGERSIFDFVNKDLGLKTRIVQFQNVKWTASEQNVININSVIGDNYGFYGEMFVDKLLSKTQEDLKKYFNESKKVINDALPTSENYITRLQNRLAIIRMTAVLVKELIEPSIDVDYITQFLIDNEKKRERELDIFEDAREKLIEYINKNIPNFVRKGVDPNYVTIPNSRVVGRIYNGNQGRLVAILPEEFDKIMKTFGDHDLILETWRDQKFLITEDGRFTKRVRISQLADSPRCYVFLFEDFAQLFNKALGLDEIDVKELEDEDFVANCAKDPNNYCVQKDPKTKKKVRYLKVPDEPVVEQANRYTKEYHDEYQKDPATIKTEPAQANEPAEEMEVNYDDDEAIDEIFDEDDSDEDDSDEGDSDEGDSDEEN